MLNLFRDHRCHWTFIFLLFLVELTPSNGVDLTTFQKLSRRRDQFLQDFVARNANSSDESNLNSKFLISTLNLNSRFVSHLTSWKLISAVAIHHWNRFPTGFLLKVTCNQNVKSRLSLKHLILP
jgi:hypothetical protein